MMRGVQLIKPGVVEVRDIAVPAADSQALVRIKTVGVCGTDSSIIAGKIPVELPRTMGHEGVVPERRGVAVVGDERHAIADVHVGRVRAQLEVRVLS